MQETLYIRFTGGDPGQLRWLEPGAGDGPAAAGSGTVEEAALYCEGRRTVLLAPADQVLLTQVRVPARNRQRALQAIPYMLEDRLIQDIDQLHFAIGARAADGTTGVAVVEKARLDQWLEQLRSVGIEPDAVIPETLGVPFEDNAWTALQDGAVTLLRTGPQSGLATDSDNLSAILSQLLEEAEAQQPERIIVYSDKTATDHGFPAELGIDVDIRIDLEVRSEDQDAFVRLARHAEERTAIDLLQGDYSRTEELSRLYRPWIASAAALAVLLAVYTGLLGYEYVRLSNQSERLQEQIENVYREAFPDANRVVNPRVQMERGLASLRSGGGGGAGDFLDMMRQVAPSLQEVDGLELERINFRENQLDFALTIGDLQHLDRLKQQLGSDPGLEVEIQSASAVGERVEARIQVRTAR